VTDDVLPLSFSTTVVKLEAIIRKRDVGNMRGAAFCCHNLATLQLFLRKALAPSAAESPRFGVLASCDANCQRPTCGNGVIDPGETCDPPFEFPSGQLWCDWACHIPTCGNGIVDPGEDCDPPKSWQPANGGPLYCGDNCTFENACTDCHTRCDPMPIPFSQCAQQFCDDGPYSPCG
jgi:hypothetical protein